MTLPNFSGAGVPARVAAPTPVFPLFVILSEAKDLFSRQSQSFAKIQQNPTMTNVEQTLARLPQITIDRLPDAGRQIPGRAHCDRKPWGALMSDAVLFANAKFVRLHLTKAGLDEQLNFQFWMDSSQDLVFIHAGQTYPRIPDVYRWEVGFVLDPTWAPTTFVKRDPLPEDRHGIWDHEHCMICQETIDNDNPHGYKNQDDIWLCKCCFDTHVAAQSLSFIDQAHLAD